MTLVEFLRARLDDDERVARAAAPGPWRIDERSPNVILEAFPIDAVGMAGEHRHNLFTGQLSSRFGQAKLDAQHIARQDPARVLAEVTAKRRVVDWCTYPDRGGGPDLSDQQDDVLRLLALSYAEHPDYREEWKP